MARSKGSANFAGSLEVLAGAPLDARTVVNVKADLTDSQSYTYVYVGMIVSVKSEGKAYILTAADFTDSNNWSELGSGGSGTGGVVEGYFNPTNDLFYEESTYETAITGESGMLYVSLDTNRLYRFNGTIFVVVSDLDATVYQPAGSVLFANLPAASAGTLGFVYDIQDDFVTTSDFIEGAGKAYSAGTNVVVINHGTSSLPIYKYDVLSGRATLPTGGTTGQVLTKSSATNYDAAWGDAFYLKYEGATLGVNNFTYNNANLVGNGETKIFHSLWSASTSSGQNAALPDTDIVSYDRNYYVEMTKSSDGLAFVQWCRKFYTIAGTKYCKIYNRRCTSSAGSWTYADWIELDASAILPVTPDQFDKANMYSTTEKVIGSWTDGRPLYQKTISCGALPNATEKKTSTGLSSSTHRIQSLKGYAYRSDNGSVIPLPNAASNYLAAVAVVTSGTYYISLSCGADFSKYTESYVTLQYTKTTDAANSFKYADENDYSTTEHIVGTWIDGKPLYQKTINFGALPNNTSKTANLSISNLKRIVKFFGYAYASTGVVPLPYASVGTNGTISLWQESTVLKIQTKMDYSAFTESYITIQYTKTTD